MEHLSLTLHPQKIRLRRYEQGVDFLGALMYRGRMYPRSELIRNVRDAITGWNEQIRMSGELTKSEVQTIIASLNASLGHLVHVSTRHFRHKVPTFLSPLFRKYMVWHVFAKYVSLKD